MMLAWSFGETELVNQVPTMLSHLIHACTVEGVDTNGDERVKVPSMNPNLFLLSTTFLTARAQAEQFSPPVKGYVTSTKLGLSAWCKNRGSSIGESCKEEDGFSGAEPLVESFVVVVVAAEAIIGKRRNFSQKQSVFLEKIEKEKKNWRKCKTLERFGDLLWYHITKWMEEVYACFH